jgi:exodeoxyribonuclease-5
MKRAAGFPGVYPSSAGEKIICLKNRSDLGLVNGLFLEFSDCRDETVHCFSAVVRSADGEVLAADGERHFVYKGHL